LGDPSRSPAEWLAAPGHPRAILTPIREGAVHGLDDIATQAKIAQAAFGIEANDPLARTCARGKAHAFEPL
jgi:hypothetical protein